MKKELILIVVSTTLIIQENTDGCYKMETNSKSVKQLPNERNSLLPLYYFLLINTEHRYGISFSLFRTHW